MMDKNTLDIKEKSIFASKHSLSKRRKAAVTLSAILLAAVVVFLVIFLRGCDSYFAAVPTVTIETPDKKSASDHKPFCLKLQLTTLGEAVYPAASFSIAFDSSKLVFLGIEEGNVQVTDSQSASGYRLPEWSVNVEHSNEVGMINLMYLDMTGGKNAFTNEALDRDGNILLYLRFKLRGTAKSGDIYALSFHDAVFAASDERKSLASSQNTLQTNNGRIVIGG